MGCPWVTLVLVALVALAGRVVADATPLAPDEFVNGTLGDGRSFIVATPLGRDALVVVDFDASGLELLAYIGSLGSSVTLAPGRSRLCATLLATNSSEASVTFVPVGPPSASASAPYSLLVSFYEDVVLAAGVDAPSLVPDGTTQLWAIDVTSLDRPLRVSVTSTSVGLAQMAVLYEACPTLPLALRAGSGPPMALLTFSTKATMVIATSGLSFPLLARGRWLVAVQFDGPGSKPYTLRVSYGASVGNVTGIGLALTFGTSVTFALVLAGAWLLVRRVNRGYIYDGEVARFAMAAVPAAPSAYAAVSFVWLTVICGAMFASPAAQLVAAQFAFASIVGDRDVCIFDESCLQPGAVFLAANNIWSNTPYLAVGLGLAVYLLALRRARFTRAVPSDYSLVTAVAVAVTFEGLLSGVYHICPTASGFQFDVAEMLVVAVLCTAELARKHFGRCPEPTALFVYVAAMIGLNFVGASAPLTGPGRWAFCALTSAFGLVSLGWAAKVVRGWDREPFVPLLAHTPGGRQSAQPAPSALSAALNNESEFLADAVPSELARRVGTLARGLVLAVMAAVIVIVPLTTTQSSEIWLRVCVVLLCVATASYVVASLARWIGRVRFHGRAPARADRWLLAGFRVGLAIATLALWCAALVFFTKHTTDKSLPAWQSRELNSACVGGSFLSAHDVWHVLSASALLCQTLLLTHVEEFERARL